jgi:RNA polymerase sigma-70 factor (ECF subfamily)
MADADEMLVERARRGDGPAFAKFAALWWEPASRVAWNMSGSAAEAAEAAQTALLTVLREPLYDESAVRIALYRVVIQLTARPPRNGAGSLDVFLPRFDGQGRLGSHYASGELQELDEQIRQTLLRLAAKDRAAFLLREIEGLALGEVASILEAPEAEIRSRIHRALTVLTGLVGQRPAP